MTRLSLRQIRFDEGLTLETSAFESLHGGHTIHINPLYKTKLSHLIGVLFVDEAQFFPDLGRFLRACSLQNEVGELSFISHF